jgi:hypothetical protein
MYDSYKFQQKYLEIKALRILDGIIGDYEFKSGWRYVGIEDLVIQLLNFEQAEIYRKL